MKIYRILVVFFVTDCYCCYGYFSLKKKQKKKSLLEKYMNVYLYKRTIKSNGQQAAAFSQLVSQSLQQKLQRNKKSQKFQ